MLELMLLGCRREQPVHPFDEAKTLLGISGELPKSGPLSLWVYILATVSHGTLIVSAGP